MIMQAAPIGAFGAMAFTIGNYGLETLLPAGEADGLRSISLACCSCFWCWGGGARARLQHLKFLRYIREELLLVLGDVVVGSGAASHDGQDGATGCRNAPRSGS